MSRLWCSKKCGFTLAAALAVLFSAAGKKADEAPLALVQTIDLKGKAGKLDHLAVDAKRQRLLVANKINGTLDIVDLKAGKLLKQVADQHGIQGIAYAADLDRIFVGLGEGGFCNIFDGQDYELKKTVKFQDDSDNVRYDPRTHLVYVAHADKALGVIDAKTYEVRTDIQLPGNAEAFQIEKERPRLYLNVPPNQVLVIDTDKNEVIEKYALTGATKNEAMALDEANHRLFIGCRKNPMVIVLDTESGKEIANVPIAADVDDVSFDAKRKLVFASCGEGFLSVIRQQDADHYEALAKMPTAKLARTHCYDADSGRLYLAVPRQEGKEGPEIRVYQAHP